MVASPQSSSIYYTVAGSGPVLVFVHSFLCDGELFRSQVEFLQNRFRIINVDIRGHGRSRSDESVFSMDDLVQDVLTVMDAEGVKQAIWVGMSIGGFVAMRAAVYQPSRVLGLVLIGTEAGAQSFTKKILDVALKTSLRLIGPRAVVPSLMPTFLGKTTRKNNPALVEEYIRIFRRMRVGSICAIIDCVMHREDLTQDLVKIKSPTLILVGEEDVPMPVSIAKGMAERISGAELAVIAGAGHLCTVEKPEAVNRVLGRFLDSKFLSY